MFNEDIREKKKIGRGSFSMRGKGVKHGMRGALKTPYHFMTSKERKKLNGKVEVSFMILDKEEFKLKDEETQKTLLTKWRETYSNKEIMEKMNINNSNAFNNLIDKLGVPKKYRTGAMVKEKTTVKPTTKATPKPKQSVLDLALETAKAPALEQAPPLETKSENKQADIQQAPIKIITNGLHLEYNGIYDHEQLSKIFTKLQLITDGEENKYSLSISLTERTN